MEQAYQLEKMVVYPEQKGCGDYRLLQLLIQRFPNHRVEIERIVSGLYKSIQGESKEATNIHQTKGPEGASANDQDGAASDGFPHFGQFTDALKLLVGADKFRQFIDFYVNRIPEHNSLFNNEVRILEKEVVAFETKESEKFQSVGLQIPLNIQTGSSLSANAFATPERESNERVSGRSYPLMSNNSLFNDMKEEFKQAKWVVLTSSLIQQQSQQRSSLKSGGAAASLGRENSLGLTTSASSTSGNFGIQIGGNGGLLSMRSQNALNSSFSIGQQAINQAKLSASLTPQKRYGHTACLVKNKMYLFGGLQKGGNSQTFYECALRFGTPADENASLVNGILFSWDKIKAEAPRARDSHTFIHAGDAMIMFGGSCGTKSFNDLYRFDLKTQKWCKLEPIGDLPAPREGHIAKLLGKDKMVVHGGVDQNETSFGDTYVLTGISQYIDQAQVSSIYAAYIPQSELKLPIYTQQFDLEGGQESINDANSQGIDGVPVADTETPQIWSTSQALRSVQNYRAMRSGGGPRKLKWYKCIERGQIPQGRDSHTSAMINNKIYIFGGQGDGDIIFDDLYSVEIIEEQDAKGETIYVAQWELIEKQTPKGELASYPKPRARTSHSATVYKNRYMVIIGGEGEFTESELSLMKISDKKRRKTGPKKKQGGHGKGANEDDITVEIDQECSSDSGEAAEKKINESGMNEEDDDEDGQPDNKRPLNDVWVFDTLTNRWHEIKAPLRIQGPLTGKKLKKEFEPRMAHSAVQLNQFVILFGGLSTEQLVSNDLYVLSLDGNLGQIALSLDPEPPTPIATPTQTIRIPTSVSSDNLTPQSYSNQPYSSDMLQTQDRQQLTMNYANNTNNMAGASQGLNYTSSSGSVIIQQEKGSKSKKGGAGGLKLTNPEDRKVMTGQILNQIINYSNGLTNQFFISGGQVTNNIISIPNYPPPSLQSNQQSTVTVDNEALPLKADCMVQTSELFKENEKDERISEHKEVDARSQILMILKQNDFRLSSFQRTKYSFIKSMADQILWPLQCFAAFIDNSIEAFDLAKLKQESIKQIQQPGQQQISLSYQRFTQPLNVEINLKYYEGGSGQEFETNCYLEIKDDGAGIHPKQLMEALTSFGLSHQDKSKSNFQFSEHGVGLKLACLRLAQSTLIITKTKPSYECGVSIYNVSFGLLSTDFMKKADAQNEFLTAPLVSLEIRNRRISRHLTPEPEHFLDMIAQFTQPKFDSGEKLMQYAINVMSEQGGTHIFLFNLIEHRLSKKGPKFAELGTTKQGVDIILNPTIFGNEHSSNHHQAEFSLLKYLQYLYVEFPTWVRISVNGELLQPANPYSTLKLIHPLAFFGDKQEKFAVQFIECEKINAHLETLREDLALLNSQHDVQSSWVEPNGEDSVVEIPSMPITGQAGSLSAEEIQAKINDIQAQIEITEQSLANLQGVLIYRGNRLIRRLESTFGEEDCAMVPPHLRNKNAIVSVFKSRVSTSLDKSDFSEKQVIKKIKEWFSLRYQAEQKHGV